MFGRLSSSWKQVRSSFAENNADSQSEARKKDDRGDAGKGKPLLHAGAEAQRAKFEKNFLDLPAEIRQLILAQDLSGQDLARVSLTCKTLSGDVDAVPALRKKRDQSIPPDSTRVKELKEKFWNMKQDDLQRFLIWNRSSRAVLYAMRGKQDDLKLQMKIAYEVFAAREDALDSMRRGLG
jgi:hypothetical protein